VREDEIDQEAMKEIRASVEEHGWFVVLLESDGYLPHRAYTVGLNESFQHPDVIVHGLELPVMEQCLHEVGLQAQAGKKVPLDKDVQGFLEGFQVRFLPVLQAHLSAQMTYATQFYGNDQFNALQLVWPDRKGYFPYQPGFYKKWRPLQKLLDRDDHFMFFEPPGLRVYATDDVIVGKEPIRLVVHGEEGEWQFSSGVEVATYEQTEIAKLVEADHSLNQLFEMGYGYYAERATKEDPFVIEPME
jgi:hypothetical protein